jgi:Proprotein convertase P-domain
MELIAIRYGIGQASKHLRFSLPIAIVMATGCAPIDEGSYLDHEELSDFEPTESGESALSSTFHRNNIMSDSFFTNVDYVDGDGLQKFFEDSPYGRSFLANESVRGTRAADAIVEAARGRGVNPVVMVARMQVEKSLISKTTRPAQSKIDFAFGCGCPDNQPCNEAYRGLDKQIDCAAATLRKWYDRSQQGTGIWNKGVAKNTLDPLQVTPENHCTASLYAYTPWVLEGKGGNWLVWNITRRFATHADALGIVGEVEPPVAPPSTGEHHQSTISKAIPDADPDGISSQLVASTSGAVGDIKVTVDIAHSYIGDLTVRLLHGGREVILHDRTGGSTDNLNQSYTVKEFAGLDRNGIWRLEVVDSAAKDTGTMNVWSFDIL